AAVVRHSRWQPRSAARKIALARIGVRRTERRRLAEGLLYRPRADRADEVSRAGEKAADAGADRGADTRGRSDRDCRRARGWRNAVEPRRAWLGSIADRAGARRQPADCRPGDCYPPPPPPPVPRPI